jgi:hypothetical protein
VNRKRRIVFQLEQDEGGFPPIAVELLNATQLESGEFRLDNAPFFAREHSFGDTVRAVPTDIEGQYLFECQVTISSFTSISIILLDREMDKFLMDLFRGHDCVIEYGEFGNHRMLAVAIPATQSYSVLRRQLTDLEEQGKLSFAELAVADA